MDQIRIENLEVFGKHGVYKEENALGQKFLVSATLYLTLHEAGVQDDLTRSVNYGEVCHYISSYLITNTFQLIETATERLAKNLLLRYDLLDAVDLEIKKPWAPIGLSLETVSVKIHRSWHECYLALGSNIGDKEQYLKHAVQSLEEIPECRVLKCSDFLLTKPYGPVEQEDFLNGVVKVKTLFTPQELLNVCHTIESDADRKREVHWGPRTLDLDILFYDELVLESENLIIPHADMEHRDFVLKPLAQVAPRKKHPVNGKTIQRMLEELEA